MKPLFYFTYANQPDDFLANLKLESNYISEVFAELVAENVFDLIKDESSYTDNVLQVLLTEAYRLEFFHYAGHAGTGTLVFGDNPLSGSGIAGLLSKAPNLKLVFLNGCGTANQVLDLHAFGVKAVLATENPIQDDTAALFAKYFYQSIAQNDTIAEAFRKASRQISLIDNQKDNIVISSASTRGFVSAEQDIAFPWSLYIREDHQEILDWRMKA